VKRGVAARPHLQALIGAGWLGTPIGFDESLALQRIDRFRRSLGGSPKLPTQHLGEAQIIYYISTVPPPAARSGQCHVDEHDRVKVAYGNQGSPSAPQGNGTFHVCGRSLLLVIALQYIGSRLATSVVLNEAWAAQCSYCERRAAHAS